MAANNLNIEMPVEDRGLIRSPILWGLMAISLALSMTLAYLLDIRFDEAFTLNTTSQGVVYAFHQAIKFEQQAPLYFVVLSLWRNVDSSIFFARLFSVLCFPLTVWVSAEAAKRYVKEINPLVAAAIVALHQQVVWGSLDIRLYSFMTFLSALLFLFFYDGYLSERPQTRTRILYILVATVALYTQYYLGFQLVAGAAALLAVRGWRTLRQYIIDMIIVGVFFLPMVFVIVGQVSVVNDRAYDPPSIFLLLNGLYQQIVSLFLSINWVEPASLKRWFVRIVIFVVAAMFLRKLVSQRRREDLALAAITAVLIAAFLVTYHFLGDEGLQQRHMSSLILPLVLLPLSALSYFNNKKIIYAWLALVVFLNIGSLLVTYAPMAKPGDFRRVAQYLTTNEAPNQPVLVFNSDAVLALSYYYKGQNKLVAIPQENDFDVWNPRNNIIKDEAQVLAIINRQPNSPERFWLVNDGWCAQGSFSYNCDILEDVVTKYFDVERSQDFLEPTTVRLLRRK